MKPESMSFMINREDFEKSDKPRKELVVKVDDRRKMRCLSAVFCGMTMTQGFPASNKHPMTTLKLAHILISEQVREGEDTELNNIEANRSFSISRLQ